MTRNIIPHLIWMCGLLTLCKGTCTFPSDLTGSWISSDKGSLEFTSSGFSGYSVHTFGTDAFTCHIQDGTKYVVKSASFRRFGLNFNAYICMDLTKVARVSSGKLYTYTKASPEESDANKERVKIKLTSIAVTAASEICTESSPYTGIPYSILMINETDAIDSVKTNCPVPFLGNFAYTYDSGSGNVCTGSSEVRVCDVKNTMTWDYTKCSQIQAYSSGGVAKCVYSSSNNDVYTTHVYNMDTSVDGSTTYRFTCYKAYGYKTVYASQYPGDCQTTQNQTYAASPGAVLVMTASLVCAYDETTSTLSAGVIAAIVICVLLVIIAIIVAIAWYFYKKRKKQKQADWEAANRKVDPDELSPNMRLGLPDESKYDLDRLMYSPEMKNANSKRTGRKDMVGLEGLEGYHENGLYMDEEQRQTALESAMFAERRKRKDAKDEFKKSKPTNKIFSDRIKNMAKGRKRPIRMATLAKLRTLKPKPRPMGFTPGDEEGRVTTTKDIVIQVEEAEGESKRKTRFADEEQPANTDRSQPAKTLEEVETLSDIPDNDLGVDDLSDDEPRLRLPNLKPIKKEKRKKRWRKMKEKLAAKRKKLVVHRYIPYNSTPFIKRTVLFRPNSGKKKKKKGVWELPPVVRPRSKPWSEMIKRLRLARRNQQRKGQSSLASNQPTNGMPHNMRFMPPKSKRKQEPEYIEEPMPLSRQQTTLGQHPLARIHRKDNPKAWKEAFGDANDESMDLEELKKRIPEDRWKKLLEELYRDKKYFDYVKKSKTDTEKDLFTAADTSLQFLYGRALFWESQQPIPNRPPTAVKRMYSRHESPTKSGKALQRSSTTMSTSGHQRLPRTPSTQVSRLKRRGTTGMDKKSKDAANKKAANNALALPPELVYFEGGTQTDFSPLPPMSPALFSQEDMYQDERLSLPGSVIHEDDRMETPLIPFQKEVTRSDIKLEEYDLDMEYEENQQQYDPAFTENPNIELQDVDDTTLAV